MQPYKQRVLLSLADHDDTRSYVPGRDIAGDQLRVFSDVPVLSPPLVCMLCRAGFLHQGAFMRHLDDSHAGVAEYRKRCLLYTSPSPRDLSTSRMPSSA